MFILAVRDKETGMPEDFGGLEWKDVTTINPVGFAVAILLGIALIFLPRRWAILPMLVIACFIPSIQKIVVLGMDFNLLRIMVMFGIVRIFLKKEYYNFVFKPLDKIMICWIISAVIIHTIQQGNSSAFINRLGFAFDAFGMYFLFRCLMRNWSDVDTIILGCLLISLPVMMAFLIEFKTSSNLFSFFGGVSAVTVVREGKLRCQGAYSHPILAGCFWASLIPLFAAYWWKSASGKWLAITGFITSTVIVFCSSSSTPVMGVLSAMIGGLFFYLRNSMHTVRWAIVVILAALHMVMNKPVWHLISRVDAVGGSTGYHRYVLIDSAIRYFNEWALVGTRSTLHWGEGMLDITNQYILEGVNAGFLTFCLFIAVIVYAFKDVGNLWRTQIHNRYYLALSWALGVSLFVHSMNFIGVSYFGQIWILWYMLLAIIGSLAPVNGELPLQTQSSVAKSRFKVRH